MEAETMQVSTENGKTHRHHPQIYASQPGSAGDQLGTASRNARGQSGRSTIVRAPAYLIVSNRPPPAPNNPHPQRVRDYGQTKAMTCRRVQHENERLIPSSAAFAY